MGIENTIKSFSGGNSSTSGAGEGGASTYKESIDQIYKVEPENWYKSKPYGFIFFDRKKKDENLADKITFWLPISPENINITTHFATNVLTTLYGVVEEHSEVRYYDIVISGTTGYGPRYYDIAENDKIAFNSVSGFKSTGREAFTSTFLESIALPGGLAAGALGAAAQLQNKATDAISAVEGGASTSSGIQLSQSGYVAFHNFYRFLLNYKKDTAGEGEAGFEKRTLHPLQFVNYKDQIRYDCIPLTFTLTRSAESPMLYNYNIKMRAYNLRNVSTLAPGGSQQELLENLGLAPNSVDSFNNALGAVSGAVGAISSLF